MTLSIILGLTSPVRAFDQSDIDHELKIDNAPIAVIQTINGEEPEDEASFTYKLTPLTDNAPMPKNGETLQLTGDSFGYFRIDFSGFEPMDTFEYALTQEKNANEAFSHDETVYHITFKVYRDDDGSLYLTRIIDNGTEKDPDADFTSTYTPPVVPVEPTVTPTPITPGINVATGIIREYGLGILAGFGLSAVVLISIMDRKSKLK